MATVRTRFAPSPTGYLHIGNARTALFNWLFARHSKGSFVLRIEDTDTARSEKRFEKALAEDLLWLGLDWDEGPGKDGAKGPYRQSERLDLYRTYAQKLIDAGHAYRCYCSKGRLEELKKAQLKAGMPPRYDGRCREFKAPPEGGGEYVLRFKVSGRPVSFTDAVHGALRFDTADFGDFVIIGSDNIAAYNFAVVIDDALMDITHVIRGDDHISNTPRQMLMLDALGLKVPSYSHIPLVLGPDRTPLGKRSPGASLHELKEGFLPEAILNSIARLGWSPGEAFMTLDEMAAAFTTERLSKSPSVFDTERLKVYNKTAMERMNNRELSRLLSVEAAGEIENAVGVLKQNAATLDGLKELIAPFIGEVTLTEDARSIVSDPGARNVLSIFAAEVEKAGGLDEASFKEMMAKVKNASGASGKKLFLPVRLVLTGRHEGIELYNVLRLLGKEKALRRLRGFNGK